MRITVSMDRAQTRVSNLGRQIDYAVSRSINATLNEAQAALRKELPLRFTLRRKTWVEQSVKISKFTTRKDLRAEFGIDPTRDVLAKFEAGGVKRAQGGRLLVPLAGAQPNKQSVIRASLRPKALGSKAFVIRTRRGELLVQRLQRAGRIQAARFGGDPRLKLLYAFESGVRIQPALKLIPTTHATFAERFARHFATEFQQALASAR